MEFHDVVMKRRAVRRFEEGGVDREVIERIARLAQRTPSAGFSQGQRLVVVTDPARASRGRPDLRRGGVRGRLRAVDQRVRRPVHPVRQRGDLPPPLPGAGQDSRTDGEEIDWPVPYWWVDIGATMQNIMLAAVDEGLGCGFVGPGHRRAAGVPRDPRRVRADRGHAARPAAPGHPLTEPQARLGPVRAVRPLGGLGRDARRARRRPQTGVRRVEGQVADRGPEARAVEAHPTDPTRRARARSTRTRSPGHPA